MFALTFSITTYDHERFDVVGVHSDESVLQALADQGNALIEACNNFEFRRMQHYQNWISSHPQPKINHELLHKARKGQLKAHEQAIVDEYTRLNNAFIVESGTVLEEARQLILQESSDVQRQYEFGGADGFYEVVACRDLSSNPSLFA